MAKKKAEKAKKEEKTEKVKIPSGTSAIRKAILSILQVGSKSLAEDSSNVTKKHIEDSQSKLIKLAEDFTPSNLKSGAKFIRDIRDKAKVGSSLLFSEGQKKDALTQFAGALDVGGDVYKASALLRSPQAKYEALATDSMKSAVKDVEGQVMYNIPELYIVMVDKEGTKKDRILGGYARVSTARASAKAYLSGIKKAYDGLIPSFTTGTTKTGRTSNTRDKLKIDSRLYSQKADGKAKAGEAVYTFENNKALQYLKEHLKKDGLKVKVIKCTDKKEHRGYWKLFNSASVGIMRWNPKKKKVFEFVDEGVTSTLKDILEVNKDELDPSEVAELKSMKVGETIGIGHTVLKRIK